MDHTARLVDHYRTIKPACLDAFKQIKTLEREAKKRDQQILKLTIKSDMNKSRADKANKLAKAYEGLKKQLNSSQEENLKLSKKLVEKEGEVAKMKEKYSASQTMVQFYRDSSKDTRKMEQTAEILKLKSDSRNKEKEQAANRKREEEERKANLAKNKRNSAFAAARIAMDNGGAAAQFGPLASAFPKPNELVPSCGMVSG